MFLICKLWQSCSPFLRQSTPLDNCLSWLFSLYAPLIWCQRPQPYISGAACLQSTSCKTFLRASTLRIVPIGSQTQSKIWRVRACWVLETHLVIWWATSSSGQLSTFTHIMKSALSILVCPSFALLTLSKWRHQAWASPLWSSLHLVESIWGLKLLTKSSLAHS